MSNVIVADAAFAKIEQVLMQGDLSKLSSQEKVSFYNRVCSSLGLNPLTKPFDYIKLNGKEVLYAKRDATDQLRSLRDISILEVRRETLGDVLLVYAKASAKDGRVDEAVGAVNIKGLSGEALANAYMKGETKAKRRVTLSICGLGFMDETEIEDVSSVVRDAKVSAINEQLSSGPTAAPEFEAADYFDPPDEDDTAGTYVIKVGKNKDKTLQELTTLQLDQFAHWYDTEKNAGKTFHPDVTEYRQMISLYVAELQAAERD